MHSISFSFLLSCLCRFCSLSAPEYISYVQPELLWVLASIRRTTQYVHTKIQRLASNSGTQFQLVNVPWTVRTIKFHFALFSAVQCVALSLSRLSFASCIPLPVVDTLRILTSFNLECFETDSARKLLNSFVWTYNSLQVPKNRRLKSI